MTFRTTVRGHKIASASRRRYIVVHVRAEDFVNEDGRYVAFARVTKRSDNIETARKAAKRHGYNKGASAVVVDTATGEQV